MGKSGDLLQRLFSALIFASIFSIAGWIIPDIYYKYLDNTQYYEVEQPVSVGKPAYSPCEETKVTLVRTSLVDTIGQFDVDLRLVETDGAQFNVSDAHFTRVASIADGRSVVRASYRLPCELNDGIYFWQATVSYKFKGIEKQYVYVTETFLVSNDKAVVDKANKAPKVAIPTTDILLPAKEVIVPEIKINNQVNNQPTPNPAPAPTPTTPTPKVCLPIVGCVL